MDVWQITVAVLRRWYVFLPLLVLSGLGAYAVGEGVKPQYEVTATAVLVPGTEESEIDNPYGSMEGTTDVLSIVLDNPATRDAVEARDLNPDYEVESRSSSSILDITVLGTTQQEGLDTASEVLKIARRELSERQTGVGIPKDAQVTMQILRAPALSEVVAEGKTRNMAIVGVVGAAGSLLVTLLFDDLVGLLKRWTRRRSERRARHADEERPRPQQVTPQVVLDDARARPDDSPQAGERAASEDVRAESRRDGVRGGSRAEAMSRRRT